MNRAIPILPVTDLGQARHFYVDRLGFEVSFEASDNGRTGLLGVRTFDLVDPFGNSLFVMGPPRESRRPPA